MSASTNTKEGNNKSQKKPTKNNKKTQNSENTKCTENLEIPADASNSSYGQSSSLSSSQREHKENGQLPNKKTKTPINY